MGGALSILGIFLGVTSLVLGLGGWQVSRLWFWFLGSALILLVGVHLLLFWLLIRVLHALEERPIQVGRDLTGMTLTEPLEGTGRLH
jgi:hypothetical protein